MSFRASARRLLRNGQIILSSNLETLLVGLFLPGLEALDLHVKVPYIAEGLGDPAQLLPKPTGPLRQSIPRKTFMAARIRRVGTRMS